MAGSAISIPPAAQREPSAVSAPVDYLNNYLNNDEFLIRGRQHFATCRGDDYHVLDAYTLLPRDISSGLDCYHHARVQLLRLAGGQSWRFVNL